VAVAAFVVAAAAAAAAAAACALATMTARACRRMRGRFFSISIAPTVFAPGVSLPPDKSAKSVAAK